MTIDEELEIYKCALIDYRVSKYLPFLKRWLKTHHGFCWYFYYEVHEITDLTILWSIRPTNMVTYWFDAGNVDSRIKLLEQAIRIAKDRSCKKNSFLTRIKRYFA
jgi:hypothetical protein